MKKRFKLTISVVLIIICSYFAVRILIRVLSPKPISNETIQLNDNIDTTLKNYKYEVLQNIFTEEFGVYIIIWDDSSAIFKTYKINNDEDKIYIDLPKEKRFAVSLLSNEIIEAKWDLENKNDKIVDIEKQYYMKPENTIVGKDEITFGWSERRFNFMFKPLAKGRDQLKFKYVRDKSDEVYSSFIIDVNIK